MRIEHLNCCPVDCEKDLLLEQYAKTIKLIQSIKYVCENYFEENDFHGVEDLAQHIDSLIYQYEKALKNV